MGFRYDKWRRKQIVNRVRDAAFVTALVLTLLFAFLFTAGSPP